MTDWKQCEECGKWMADKPYHKCYDCYEEQREENKRFKRVCAEQEKKKLRQAGVKKLFDALNG
tara:strand:+ start:60 stop:248 length:189 start_codon:yes stop_codon:yes gene_type:complete